ncbi:S24 family peptidase [Roseibium sp.]|uniref:S24 family peptidase n=1 Tax=Roseibium sp. TaxID=1936156 RepID=UPI003A98384B
MLSHAQIWAAIDGLAQRNGLSPSGLAKRAGLDPTTFNPSKRFASDGRPRWPSTESLAKILEATGEPLSCFAVSMQQQVNVLQPGQPYRDLPVAGLAAACDDQTFVASGTPSGDLWARFSFPDPAIKGMFALEVAGDDMLPLYRDGDVIIVAPDMPLRRGDRVVVKQKQKALSVLSLHRRTSMTMEFCAVNAGDDILKIQHRDIDWVGRILWASQ